MKTPLIGMYNAIQDNSDHFSKHINKGGCGYWARIVGIKLKVIGNGFPFYCNRMKSKGLATARRLCLLC